MVSNLLRSLFFTFAMTLSYCTQAQDYKTSIGLRLGTYIGASANTYIGESSDIEIVGGITRRANQTDYVFGGFYKWHRSLTNNVPTINWYAGPGLLFFLEEENNAEKILVTPGILMGLEYSLETAPFNFFIDTYPAVRVNTSSPTKFILQANLGVRFTITTN